MNARDFGTTAEVGGSGDDTEPGAAELDVSASDGNGLGLELGLKPAASALAFSTIRVRPCGSEKSIWIAARAKGRGWVSWGTVRKTKVLAWRVMVSEESRVWREVSPIGRAAMAVVVRTGMDEVRNQLLRAWSRDFEDDSEIVLFTGNGSW